MKKPTLYQFAVSCSAEKVRRALNHKHIQWETVEVDWFDRRNLVKASGQKLVPILVHDGNTVGPSSIEALDYIEDNFAGPSIYSDDSRALCHMIDSYVEGSLFRMGLEVFFPAAAAVFKSDAFDRDVIERMGKSPSELAALLPRNKEKYQAHLAIWDQHFARRRYFLGDKESAADFILISNYWFNAINPQFKEIIDSMGFTNVQRWAGRMYETWKTPLPF
jgi:glutathione S-transferase